MGGTGTTGSSMYASRVTGFSHPRHNSKRSLFLTQPQMQGFGALDLSRGEQVELVALTGKGVFRFMCTIDATSREPFSYIVLSAPGAIRRLRTRKFTRIPTCLAARFSPEGDAGTEQLARVSDISPYGMSLMVIAPAARVGDRLQLSSTSTPTALTFRSIRLRSCGTAARPTRQPATRLMDWSSKRWNCRSSSR